jgi:hypothetical protein
MLDSWQTVDIWDYAPNVPIVLVGTKLGKSNIVPIINILWSIDTNICTLTRWHW